LRSNNSFLTLVASFCLSAVAYNVAQPVEVPVQHLEFDDYVIKGHVQRLQFDDYEIRIVRDEETTEYIDMEVIDMDELIIIAQEDEADDGDGVNINMMNANWCLIHPDDVICQDQEEEDELEGC
jgi:pyruvate/2-oxoacid:ferredoxin oxidoreductase alpha subunit